MGKQMTFPAYDGKDFLEYLLKSEQATGMQYDGDTLVIEFSDKYDRFSKKQKAQLIKAKLQERGDG